MSTLQSSIESGTVSFEDGNPAADSYDPKRKVRVELKFIVYDDQSDPEAVLRYAGDCAKAEVGRLLGRIKAAATEPTPAPPAAEPEKAPRTRRTREQIAADEAAAKAAAEGNGSPPTSSGSQGSGDAGNAGTPPGGGDGAPQTSGAPADPATPPASGDEWGTDAATADVSDAELNSACSTTAERVGDPTKVRDTIQSFNTKPAGEKFKVTEIPQTQRAAFLAKLAALTKA